MRWWGLLLLLLPPLLLPCGSTGVPTRLTIAGLLSCSSERLSAPLSSGVCSAATRIKLLLDRLFVLHHQVLWHLTAILNIISGPLPDQGLLFRHLHGLEPGVHFVLIMKRHPLLFRNAVQRAPAANALGIVLRVCLCHFHVVGKWLA